MIRLSALLLAALAVNPTWDGRQGPSDVRLVPGGFAHYLVRAEGAEDVILAYSPLEMWPLADDSGWVGEFKGAYQSLIRTNAVDRGTSRLLFKEGRLIFAADRHRRFTVKPVDHTRSDKTLAALWPDLEVERRKALARADLWRGGTRLRLGYLNPNAAATLCAEIAALAWALLLFGRGLWRLPGALGCLGGLLALLMTASRGGFLAFLAGASVPTALWIMRRGRTIVRRHVKIVSAVVLMAALGIAGGMFALGHREGRHGYFSQENATDRRALWRAAPQMIVDAPDGWGIGQAGTAFMDWYGGLERTHVVRTLINSHLTWLVEFGRWGRLGYLFLWCTILLFAGAAARHGRSEAAAAWIVLFLSAVFNPVAESPTLWILPVVVSVPAVLRLRTLGRGGLVRLTALAVILTGLLAGVGGLCCRRFGVDCHPEISLVRHDGCVYVNGLSPSIGLVDDTCGSWALSGGGFLGREIRAAASEIPPDCALLVTDDFRRLPQGLRRIALAGRTCVAFAQAVEKGEITTLPREVIFLSPMCEPSEISEKILQNCIFKMYVGELAVPLWRRTPEVPAWVTIVPKAEVYLPDWLTLVVAK